MLSAIAVGCNVQESSARAHWRSAEQIILFWQVFDVGVSHVARGGVADRAVVTYWEIALIYCSCGRNMKSSQKPTEFEQNNYDVTSILGYVFQEEQQSWCQTQTF